jgi:hypothetical protein
MIFFVDIIYGNCKRRTTYSFGKIDFVKHSSNATGGTVKNVTSKLESLCSLINPLETPVCQKKNSLMSDLDLVGK